MSYLQFKYSQIEVILKPIKQADMATKVHVLQNFVLLQ